MSLEIVLQWTARVVDSNSGGAMADRTMTCQTCAALQRALDEKEKDLQHVLDTCVFIQELQEVQRALDEATAEIATYDVRREGYMAAANRRVEAAEAKLAEMTRERDEYSVACDYVNDAKGFVERAEKAEARFADLTRSCQQLVDDWRDLVQDCEMSSYPDRWSYVTPLKDCADQLAGLLPTPPEQPA